MGLFWSDFDGHACSQFASVHDLFKVSCPRPCPRPKGRKWPSKKVSQCRTLNSFISGQQSFNRQRSANEASACRRFFDPEKCAKEIFKHNALNRLFNRFFPILWIYGLKLKIWSEIRDENHGSFYSAQRRNKLYHHHYKYVSIWTSCWKKVGLFTKVQSVGWTNF